MRGVICQKPSDLAEKLTCEPETDIRHCAASPELWGSFLPLAASSTEAGFAGPCRRSLHLLDHRCACEGPVKQGGLC